MTVEDHRDPICGMQGTLQRHGHWFCSEGCADTYAERQAGHASSPSWWRDPWVLALAAGLLAGTLGWWWPAAAPISQLYRGYLRMMAWPFLAGLVLGGVIDHFVPREYIVRLLAGPKKRVIARATLLGFLASTCSHGCLALAIELHRKGASTPAAISFLLASPWASMSLTFILLSLFGWLGLLIIVASLVVAFITGLLLQRLTKRKLLEANPLSARIKGYSIRRDMADRWRRYPWTGRQLVLDARGVCSGTVSLGRMVIGWVQLGAILSSLFGALVPHATITHYFGRSFGGLGLTLLIATLIEVCSEGSAPMAFELYRHTGALGNAFAFLMGGVVTDYTELAAVWVNIGRRTVLWTLAITLPMVLAVGWLMNTFAVARAFVP